MREGVVKTDNARTAVNTALGVIGATLINLLGGWDIPLQTLVGFLGTDYTTGIIVAGVFHKSAKTEGGALSSAAGLRGLFKKGGMLVLVYIACRLDMLIGSHYIRNAAVIALVANETVSIVENLGLMGVPIPSVITKGIEQLKSKEYQK